MIDVDGSCRDVNFPDVSRSEAVVLVKHAESIGELRNAYASKGDAISAKEIIECLSSPDGGTIHSSWTSSALVSEFQLFIAWDKDTDVFIELTFFPQDLDKDAYSLNAFLNWLKPFLVALDTKAYFVRYENASWEYGDTGETSGVIFTNSEYPING